MVCLDRYETLRAGRGVLAERRMTKALHSIRVAGNLSNRNNYEFSRQDAKKIASKLFDEGEVLAKKFASATSSTNTEFKL